jgi:hypothetical protein
MSNVTAIFGGAALILLVIALVVAGPIFTILALNTLFTLSIPITVGTWASSYLLISFFKPMTNCCDKS